MQDQTIVCLSITDWDAPQVVSRQQIMRRLAEKNRILYVEPPRALHSLITDPKKSLLQWKRWLTGGLREGPGRMTVASPPPVFPFFYHPISSRLNQRIVIRYVRKVLKKLGWQPDIFWTYWPNSAAHVGAYEESLDVYHCTDNFMVARYPLTSPEIISSMEQELASKVDLVMTRTQGLADRLGPASKAIEVVGGGVDPDAFDPARDTPQPKGLMGLQRPLVGMVATIDDRLDLPMVLGVARAIPDATIVFVGHIRGHLIDLGPLLKEPNIRFLPAVAHEHVPSYLRHLDVCFIPFLLNEYTREVAPIKLYECLAMSKPIVATRLPYIEREQDFVDIAGSAEEAIAAIRRHIDTPPSESEKARWRAAAMPWTWDKQVEHIETLVEAVKAGS